MNTKHFSRGSTIQACLVAAVVVVVASAVALISGQNRSSIGSGQSTSTLTGSESASLPPSDPPATMPDAGGVGATIAAAPRDANPTINEQDALSDLAASDLVKTLNGSTVEPSNLRLVLYANLFGTVHDGGTDTPSVPQQLAWLGQYNNFAAPVNGGAAGPSQESSSVAPRSDPNYSCRLYVAVSAATGSVLDSFDFCMDF
jgi:hypothetical protein